MNTPVQNNTAVAPAMPASMFNRGDAAPQVENVMTTIHSIKVYNPAPGSDADPQLAGKLMIKSPGAEKYQEFVPSVGMNILKINKAMNGQYNVLDEAGQLVLDNNGEPKKGFAFTEEYFRFSRNTNEVFFKDNTTNQVTKETIGNLKALFKAKTINGVANRFYTVALDRNRIPYDSSFMRESFIVYGVFTEGQFAGEYFRLFMSAAAFGNKWDTQTKTSTIVPGSLAASVAEVQEAFNAMAQTQKLDGRFDDSHIVTTLSAVKDGNYFKPSFSNNALVAVDNTIEYDYISDLIATYKEQTFNAAQPQYAKLEGADSSAKQIAENTQVNQAPVNQAPVNNGYAPQPTHQAPVNEVPVNQAPVNNTAPTNSNATQDEGISIEDIPF